MLAGGGVTPSLRPGASLKPPPLPLVAAVAGAGLATPPRLKPPVNLKPAEPNSVPATAAPAGPVPAPSCWSGAVWSAVWPGAEVPHATHSVAPGVFDTQHTSHVQEPAEAANSVAREGSGSSGTREGRDCSGTREGRGSCGTREGRGSIGGFDAALGGCHGDEQAMQLE